MWFFYVMSLLPLAVGFVLWIRSWKVVWWEWAISFGASLIVGAIFHVIALTGMTADSETWSGEITHVTFYPEWVEEYQDTETYTTTNSKGETETHTRTVTRHRTHYEEWIAYTNIDTHKNVTRQFYEQARGLFGGGIDITQPWKPGFDSGDRNVYTVRDQAGYRIPINEHRMFQNRIKAAPTLFSFPAVPKGAPVFDYPENKDWLVSDRILGTAKGMISTRQLDLLNAKLGPEKKANIIIVGFPSHSPQDLALQQRAKWIGGKKNDLVICYGGGSTSEGAEWAYVFGWTEKEIVKQNLQTIFLNNPINDSILKQVDQEVRANYVIKDWSKFDYITIEPPMWSYIVFFVVMIGSQTGIWIWSYRNEIDKDESVESKWMTAPR